MVGQSSSDSRTVGLFNPRGFTGMFYGYIDESGDEQTNLRTLSCFAGHWSQLVYFQNDWEKGLEKKNEQLKAQGREYCRAFTQRIGVPRMKNLRLV